MVHPPPAEPDPVKTGARASPTAPGALCRCSSATMRVCAVNLREA